LGGTIGTRLCPGANLATATGGGTKACSIKTPPVVTPGANPSLEDSARAQASMQLDGMIGAYLRGEIAVYAGSATASDNQRLASGFANAADEVLSAAGTALAQISGLSLDIVSTCEGAMLELQQSTAAPGQTTVSAIGRSSQYSGTCDGCVPDLTTRPARLTWNDAVAMSAPNVYPDGLGAFRSVSSADLRRESPCDLTWDQIAALGPVNNNYLSGFVRMGNEMVVRYQGTVTMPPSGRTCDGKSQSYTIDLYVNVFDLSDYGARNFQAGPVTPLCGA
jgi:hypothetical protein